MGALYLAFKLLADGIWLRNVYRKEFNGNGAIVHRASRRAIQLLGVLQLCTGLKFLGEGNVEAVVCVVAVFTLTIMVNNEFFEPFIGTEMLDRQRINPSVQTLSNWRDYFSHPIEKDGDFKDFIMPVLEYSRTSFH